MALAPTGWQGLYSHIHNEAGYSTATKINNTEQKLNRLLRKSAAGRKIKATLYALTGAVAGSSKALNKVRVQAVASPGVTLTQGGVVPIETVAVQSGNTVSGDVTTLKAVMDYQRDPGTYPTNLDGVGSGNRAGKI